MQGSIVSIHSEFKFQIVVFLFDSAFILFSHPMFNYTLSFVNQLLTDVKILKQVYYYFHLE